MRESTCHPRKLTEYVQNNGKIMDSILGVGACNTDKTRVNIVSSSHGGIERDVVGLVGVFYNISSNHVITLLVLRIYIVQILLVDSFGVRK